MTLIAPEFEYHPFFQVRHPGASLEPINYAPPSFNNVKLLPKCEAQSIKSEGPDHPPQGTFGGDNPFTRKIPPLIPVRLRPRRERPCDQCRQRKTRCVAIEGHYNLCTYCKAHGTTCTFVQPPTPRKRRPRVSIREDEHKILTNTRCELSHKDRKPKKEQPPTSLELLPRNKTTSFDLPLLDLLDYGQDLCAVKSPFGDVQKTGENGPRGLSEDQSDKQDAEFWGKVREVVGTTHKRLLELYQKFVHPHYPILNWKCFCNQVDQEPPKVCLALLVCVYLAALDWWDYLPDSSSLPRPKRKALRKLAFESLSSPRQHRALCTVQAKLLLLLLEDCRTWEGSCAVVSLAQQLNLHQDCSTWGLTPELCQLRKQIAWTVFLQDKWNAWTYGQPSHIQKDDWSVPFLTENDWYTFEKMAFDITGPRGLGSGIGEQSYTHFILLIRLTEVLGDVLQTLYTETATKDRPLKQTDVIQTVRECVGHLQSKIHDIAPHLPLLNAAEKIDTAQHVTSIPSLRLAYYTVDIQLHRLLITVMSEPLNLAEQKLPAAFLSEPRLYELTRGEAKSKLVAALEFLNRLSPTTHLRHTFWHSFAPDAFASMVSYCGLLMATAPTQEEAEFFNSRIRELAWTVTVGRKSSWVLRKAVDAQLKVIETLRNLKTKHKFTEVRDLVHKQAATNHDARELSRMTPIHERSEEGMEIDTHSEEGDDEEESSEHESTSETTARRPDPIVGIPIH